MARHLARQIVSVLFPLHCPTAFVRLDVVFCNVTLLAAGIWETCWCNRLLLEIVLGFGVSNSLLLEIVLGFGVLGTAWGLTAGNGASRGGGSFPKRKLQLIL